MSERTERTVHGRTISFSNLDRVMYPGAGYTKGDVVDYYDRIAATMLPHVRGRLLSLQRFPDGIGGESFYQKDTPDWFPDWIRTVEVEKKDGVNCQVAVEDPATLAFLAQQGSLTLHAWLSRADRPRVPDRIVFDFDPAKEDWAASFADVRWSARRLKDVLEAIGLAPYVMLSGSSGLHVHVPIEPADGFDDVKRLARDVCGLLARRYPDRLTVELRKAERGGRIFLDYLRNEYAQTAVAPYSLRARPEAPVAAPLAWDELSASGMNPRRYTLANIFRRLGARDDPWVGLDDDARPTGPARAALDDLLAAEDAG